MFMSVSRIGALIDKTRSKVGAYSEGGAYWREGPKSSHYGIPIVKLAIRILFITECIG